MANTSGVTTSLWMATGATPAQPPLTEDTFADVCVVGAGIAGMTTAYLLTQAGRTVVVLDDGPVGGGQTQRTTAHLSNAIDDRYHEIERLHGREGARLAAESHTAAIDCIEAIVRWNDTEKTWDCPCHGSRFDQFGHVMNGPANRDLPAISANGGALASMSFAIPGKGREEIGGFVRRHPVPSVLLGMGLGYMVGRAFRGTRGRKQ